MCRLCKGGSGGISALFRLRDFWEGNLHLGQPRCCCASVVSQCSFHASLDPSSPFLALKHLHLTVPQDILLLLHSLVIFRWVFVTPLFLSHPLLDKPHPVIFSCFCQLFASFSCSHPVSFGCFPFPLSLLSFCQSEMPRRAQGMGKKNPGRFGEMGNVHLLCEFPAFVSLPDKQLCCALFQCSSYQGSTRLWIHIH